MCKPLCPLLLGLWLHPTQAFGSSLACFHLLAKFFSLCFLLGSFHQCAFKSTDSFPCNEQSIANPSLLYLISDVTALLSSVRFVFSESSLKIFEHMGHSYGNLISPSVNPNACISSGFVLVDRVFSSLQVIFFCFFACLVIFWLDTKCWEFHLVGCWVTLNFLQDAIEFLHVLESCFWFVRWDQCLLNLGLSFSSVGVNSEHPTWCHQNCQVHGWEKTVLQGLCECRV